MWDSWNKKSLIEAGKNRLYFSTGFPRSEPRRKNFRELTAAALGREPDPVIITYMIMNFATEMLMIENHESISENCTTRPRIAPKQRLKA
jgi:hypothetical protein